MIYFHFAVFLLSLVVPMIKAGLKFLGIGTVTYMGLNLVLDNLYNQILAQFSSSDPAIAMLMGIAKLDVAINIYMSAIVTKFFLSGMDKGSGLLTKFKQQYKPGV